MHADLPRRARRRAAQQAVWRALPIFRERRTPDARQSPGDPPDIYPAGRLDADSEGLVVLTANGALQARIAHPRHKMPKTYWVQVEGTPGTAARALGEGVDRRRSDARDARAIAEPALWPRDPPIRKRRAIPTAWL